jgi:hypothetical protein
MCYESRTAGGGHFLCEMYSFERVVVMQCVYRERNVSERLVKIPRAIAGLTPNLQTGGPEFSFGVVSLNHKVQALKTASCESHPMWEGISQYCRRFQESVSTGFLLFFFFFFCNPNVMHEVPVHDLQVGVRCSVSAETRRALVFSKTRVALILTQFLGEFI